MKVISPDDTSHIFYIIPRDYDLSILMELEIYDETTKVRDSFVASYVNENGYIKVTFNNSDYTGIDFYENGKYQLKLHQNSKIIYRGKMIATSQTPQNYKLTNGLYI